MCLWDFFNVTADNAIQIKWSKLKLSWRGLMMFVWIISSQKKYLSQHWHIISVIKDNLGVNRSLQGTLTTEPLSRGTTASNHDDHFKIKYSKSNSSSSTGFRFQATKPVLVSLTWSWNKKKSEIKSLGGDFFFHLSSKDNSSFLRLMSFDSNWNN